MEIRELLTFKTIVATRSFSKAADQLGYTQSTVSMQIQRLEAELGTKLLTYQQRRVQVTEAGQRLLPLVEQTLTSFDDVTHWATRTQEMGRLRIAAPESLTISLLATKLQDFQQQWPLIELQLQNATCLHNEEALLRHEVDVAFMMWPSQPDVRLVDHDLGLQDIVLVASRANLTYEALLADRTATFVINEPDCSYRNQFETALWQQHQRKFRTMMLPSIAAIKATVINGVGFSYLPRKMVQQELTAGELFEVPTDIDNHVHAHLLTRRDQEVTPQLATFLNLFETVTEK